MDIYNATEEAYKKGYEDGKRDAVVHAKWVWDELFHDYTCSNCHNWDLKTPNYCSNCGAKMDMDLEV